MKTFKQYFEEAINDTEAVKGAFKDYPVEQQPKRIPIELYNDLETSIRNKVGSVGELFIPSIKKITHKNTTGDLDVIINPKNRNTWRQDILNILQNSVIASNNNGPQMMLVVKNLLSNGEQYMIDFILAKEGSFDYRKKYSQFGTIIPAVLGSFARSLRYKYDQNGLYLRMKDKKGNYHNILLTSDYDKTLQILMVDPNPVYNDDLYTPDNVAKWITDSPRFDSNIWKTPPSPDGQTIVTKNVKSHRAAKSRGNVKEAYNIIDNTNKTATWDNTNYKIERIVLGDNYVDSIEQQINNAIKISTNVVTGSEIMNILNIPSSPQIGTILKHINNQKFNRQEALYYINSLK